MGQPDQRLVEFIEVEPVPHGAAERAQLGRQRIPAGSAVEGVGKGKTEGDRPESDQRGQRRIVKGCEELLQGPARAPEALGSQLPRVEAIEAEK
ncbi:MAG: hypothetical protein DME25_22125, partial [Verrucomicrobia bacterium]